MKKSPFVDELDFKQIREKIALVKFAEELGTMSKNRLRWITLVRGPIMGDSLSHLNGLLCVSST